MYDLICTVRHCLRLRQFVLPARFLTAFYFLGLLVSWSPFPQHSCFGYTFGPGYKTRFFYVHRQQHEKDYTRTHILDLYGNAMLNSLQSDPALFRVAQGGLRGPVNYVPGCDVFSAHVNYRVLTHFVHILEFRRDVWLASKGANGFQGYHTGLLDTQAGTWRETRKDPKTGDFPHWCEIVELAPHTRPPPPPFLLRLD